MKTLSKLTLLLALVIGGKLSKSSVPAAVANQAPVSTGTETVMVTQREAFRPVQTTNRQDKPAQAQVLSIFIK